MTDPFTPQLHAELGLPAPMTPGLPPWSVFCEPDVVLLHRPTARAVRRVPAGRQVAIALEGPFARLRLRALARRCGVSLSRELVAVPSVFAPVAVFDDEESAVRRFWTCVVTVPPGVTAGSPALTAGLRVARRLPWSWTGALAPGRVIIGRRT